MISARPSSRNVPNRVAISIRVAAFVVAAGSALLVPAMVAGAATGHGDATHALTVAAAAALLTLVTALAARSLDPLRH